MSWEDSQGLCIMWSPSKFYTQWQKCIMTNNARYIGGRRGRHFVQESIINPSPVRAFCTSVRHISFEQVSLSMCHRMLTRALGEKACL